MASLYKVDGKIAAIAFPCTEAQKEASRLQVNRCSNSFAISYLEPATENHRILFCRICMKKSVFFYRLLSRGLSHGCSAELRFHDKEAADGQECTMPVATVYGLVLVHFYNCQMTPFVKVQVRDSPRFILAETMVSEN